MKFVRKYWAGVALTFLCFATASNAAGFPKGTFTVKTSDSYVWDLNLDDKGKFHVKRNGTDAVSGAYKLNKDEIEFTDESGPLAEQGAAKTGTYKWKYADKKLEFTIIKDDADGRSMTLTSGPWEKKE
jgi:hypothetical protein